MPGSIAQAPQGGTSPGQGLNLLSVTKVHFEVTSSQQLETSKDNHQEEGQEGLHQHRDQQGHQQVNLEGAQLHHHHLQSHNQAHQQEEEGEKAVTTACINRMPDSIVQASGGGTSPGQGLNKLLSVTQVHFEVTSSQHHPPEDEGPPGHGTEGVQGDHHEGREQGHLSEDGKPQDASQGVVQGDHRGEEARGQVWVAGAGAEDNQRYKNFLKYMEDRRQEARDQHIEDEERKARSRKRRESFELLRTCLDYLKEKEDVWRMRKIDECERIKEEEKKDRLAVCKEKKRWYGIKKLSKEENAKLKMRTEERLEISRGKTNLWRKFGTGREWKGMKEEERETWEEVRRLTIELEEEGEWRAEGIKLENVQIIRPRIEQKTPALGSKEEKPTESGDCQGGKEEPEGDMKKVEKDSKMSALGVGGGHIARGVCQGELKEQETKSQAGAGGDQKDEIRNTDGVEKGRCAPTPNCFDWPEGGGGKEEMSALGVEGGHGVARDTCQGDMKDGEGGRRAEVDQSQEDTVRDVVGVNRPEGGKGKEEISAWGVEGRHGVARRACQGDMKEGEGGNRAEADQRQEDMVKNVAGVEGDRCAPTPNCLRQGGRNLEEKGGKDKGGISQKIRCWEGREEVAKRKESGSPDQIKIPTIKKRQHSGTFTLKTRNISNNDHDYEGVMKLVEHWEGSGKESGTKEQGQRVYCFGRNTESEQMVGSPLKRRRICPPTSPGTSPRLHTRPPGTPSSRRGCSPTTWSPGTGRRRPTTTATGHRRAQPSTLLNKERVVPDRNGSTSSSWRGKAGSTRPGTSCSTVGSTSVMISISDVHTSEKLTSQTKQGTANAGSSGTSTDKPGHVQGYEVRGYLDGDSYLRLDHHLLCGPPEHEGASVQPLGSSITSAQPETAENDKELQSESQKALRSAKLQRGSSSSSPVQLTERKKHNKVKLEENLEKKAKKQRIQAPKHELKFRFAGMKKIREEDEESKFEKKFEFEKKFGRKKVTKKEEVTLYQDEENLSVTNLHVREPEDDPPGEPSKPGTAGVFLTSPWSCSRATPGSTQGEGFSLGRSTGEYKGISKLGGEDNITTLYGTAVSNRAATISLPIIPQAGTQTTGQTFPLICGAIPGLKRTSRNIPGDYKTI